ncbi:hypothetical protein M885DRAFT_618205 [Pelagophyceae sp. CCMP2097]|nr:hypothetical protein M885DRAFT_618205 [Pelagophyceae sp. CCMP2097]
MARFAFCLLLALPALAVAAASPRPTPFPAAASYDCVLTTTAKSKLCSTCTFVGRHYYNSDPSKAYGHVAWQYGPSGSNKTVNFMDIFHGADQAMFLVQDLGSGKAQCMRVPHADPVFNATWADNAEYVGVGWFHSRLAHQWDRVFPFFIQGEVEEGSYFEDVFTHLPLGFENTLATLVYGESFQTAVPDDKLFTSIEDVECGALLLQFAGSPNAVFVTKLVCRAGLPAALLLRRLFWEARIAKGTAILDCNFDTKSVTSCAFSRDGALISAWNCGTKKRWDVSTGAVHPTQQPRRDLLRICKGTGYSLSARYTENYVLIPPAGTRWSGRRAFKTSFKWISVSADGLRALARTLDDTLQLRNAKTAALLATLEGQAAPRASYVFSPDGKRIVTLSYEDKTLMLWDAA